MSGIDGTSRKHVPGVVTLSQFGDLLVDFRRDFNLLEVTLDTLRLDGLGDHRVATVGTPSDKDLRRGSTELLRNLLHDRLVGQLGLANGC